MEPFSTVPCRVQQIKQETNDTFTLTLKPAALDGKFSFCPGQFNMLYAFGAGEVPVSVSGHPGKPELLVHTIRSVGMVTAALGRLKKNDAIGVRGPFGSSWPVQDAVGNDVVLVAGGIGLAPLRPAMYQVLREREKYGKVVLLYGSRTPDDILYMQEIMQWRAQFDLQIYVCVDRASGEWKGNTGVVTSLFPKVFFDPNNTTAMICGPEVMMRFAILELLKRGVPAKDIFVSMERNMKCATGFCGHCQFGPYFVCKDGPVFCYEQAKDWIGKREI